MADEASPPPSLRKRLADLQREHDAGVNALGNLQRTIHRIEGAMQILRDLIAEEASSDPPAAGEPGRKDVFPSPPAP